MNQNKLDFHDVIRLNRKQIFKNNRSMLFIYILNALLTFFCLVLWHHYAKTLWIPFKFLGSTLIITPLLTFGFLMSGTISLNPNKKTHLPNLITEFLYQPKIYLSVFLLSFILLYLCIMYFFIIGFIFANTSDILRFLIIFISIIIFIFIITRYTFTPQIVANEHLSLLNALNLSRNRSIGFEMDLLKLELPFYLACLFFYLIIIILGPVAILLFFLSNLHNILLLETHYVKLITKVFIEPGLLTHLFLSDFILLLLCIIPIFTLQINKSAFYHYFLKHVWKKES